MLALTNSNLAECYDYLISESYVVQYFINYGDRFLGRHKNPFKIAFYVTYRMEALIQASQYINTLSI